MADGSPRTVAGAAGVFPFPLSPRRRRTCRLPRPLHRFRGGGQLPSGVSSISRRACEGGGRYRPRTKPPAARSEEHTSELQSLMRISYAVFCLKKKTINTNNRDLTS